MPIFDKYPQRIILTDDTLRAEMLAAHHLEHVVTVCERDDIDLFYDMNHARLYFETRNVKSDSTAG